MAQPDANQANLAPEETSVTAPTAAVPQPSTTDIAPAEAVQAQPVPVVEPEAPKLSASSLIGQAPRQAEVQVAVAPVPAAVEPAPQAAEPVAAPAPAPVARAHSPFIPINSAPLGDMQVIVLANQKGGVAKTTTTLNLAVAFAESGHRVLCVDLDPQANLSVSQGLPDDLPESMYNVLLGQIPLSQVIHKREVDVAVSSIDVAGAELALSSTIGRERALQRALSTVKDDYDFVFIDTPPSLGLLTINAFTAAHRVIVPVQCEYLSMRGLLQLENTLQMVRENLNPSVRIQGIVQTMVDARTLHAQEAIELLEENFSGRVFRSRINRTVRFAEAPVEGMSIMKYEPKGAAAQSYRDLAKEVMEYVQ